MPLPLLLSLPALLAAVQTPPGDEPSAPVSFELVLERDAYYVHEPVPVRLRIAADEAFLAERLVPLFRRRLDVPVQVLAPWADGLAGAERAPSPAGRGPGADAGASFVLNDEVVHGTLARETRLDGGVVAVLTLELVYLPAAPGPLRIPGARLRYAHAARFEADLLDERIPVDPIEELVAAPGRELSVRPLPAQGRPARFSGVVGEVAVRASLDRRETRVGESVRLALELTGPAGLARIQAPRLELDGFQVYGHLEEPSAAGRRFVYDVAPRAAGLRHVPAIPFTYFDPATAAYRTARTLPLPLRVAPTEELDAPPRPRDAGEPRVEPRRLRPTTLIVLVVGVVVLALVVGAVLRRPSGAR